MRYIIYYILALMVTINCVSALGYQLIKGGEVLDIWNTPEYWNNETIHYYFNTSNGAQFTNDPDGAWSKNIFCSGFKLIDWVYDCTDKLNFNWNIYNDSNEINITGYRNKTLFGRIIRYGVRYHLGRNDSNLSIQPFMKGLSGDVPDSVTLGFLWNVTDIDIGLDDQTDWVEADNYSKYLNESFNFQSSNLENTKVTFRDVDEYLWIKWDKNLNYTVYANNESFKLLITTQGLNEGQTKNTSIQWLDAGECTWSCGINQPVSQVNVNAEDIFNHSGKINRLDGLCPRIGTITGYYFNDSWQGLGTLGGNITSSIDFPVPAGINVEKIWEDTPHDPGFFFIRNKCDFNGENIYSANRSVNVSPIPINPCRTYQEVNNDLTFTEDNNTCFNITANDLVFDCDGHSITGENQIYDYQIVAENVNNVTIKNCNFNNLSNVFTSINNNNTFFLRNNVSDGNKISPSESFLRMFLYERNINITFEDNIVINQNSDNTLESLSSNTDHYVIYFNDSVESRISNNFYENISASWYELVEGFPTEYSISNVYTLVESNETYLFNEIVGNGIIGSAFNFDENSFVIDINDSFFPNSSVALTLQGNKVNFVNNFFNNSERIYFQSDNANVINNIFLSENYDVDQVASLRFSGDNVVIKDNYVDGASVFAGIVLDSTATNTTIVNNTVNNTRSTYSAHGAIYTSLGSHTIANNTVQNYDYVGSDSAGIVFTESSNDVHGNKLLNSLNGDGVLFSITGIANITNVFISGIQNSTDYDVKTYFCSGTITNSTFNKSNTYAYTGETLTNQYFVDVNVINASGQPTSGVEIFIYNNTNDYVGGGFTDSNGFKRFAITEYVQKGQGYYVEGCNGSSSNISCKTPHKINVSFDGAINESIELVGSYRILNFTVYPIISEEDTCTPPVSGDWTMTDICLLQNIEYLLPCRNFICTETCYLQLQEANLTVANMTFIGNRTMDVDSRLDWGVC